MKCPVCSETNLIMSERQGVEIDYCPECRGVWLDRGELDKIIERSALNESAAEPLHRQQPSQHQQAPHYEQSYDKGQYKHQHQGHAQGYPYKKKKSFLSEIFDFD